MIFQLAKHNLFNHSAISPKMYFLFSKNVNKLIVEG